MPQDAFTLRFLTNELNSLLTGGKINRIVQPSSDEVVFSVYTGVKTEKFSIDVNPANPKMGITEMETERGLDCPNFCMLLRKHLLNAEIQGLTLIAFDRIVKIDLDCYSDFSNVQKKSLYVELMGRYSNIILVQEGKILGGNRGINMFDNGVRPLIVGKTYVYPPTNDKLLPSDKKLESIFAESEEGLEETICKTVQGIAPITAKEAVIKFCEQKGITKETLKNDIKELAKEFFAFFNEFVYSNKTNPCVVIENGEVKDVCAFPYTSIQGEVKYFDKLYKAEDYYFTNKKTAKQLAERKERLTSVINTHVKKIKKRLSTINAKIQEAQNNEENRIKGELILSNVYKIKQGEKQVRLDNYYDGTKIDILLDERQTPSKNAESYFKKYNKQKRTLIALKPQKEQAENEIDYLESMIEEISLAENIEEINSVYAEAESYNLIKTQNAKRKQQTAFCRTYNVKGFVVKVGRNNIENDKITFSANAKDMWMHVKDYHSAHLIIEHNGKEITKDVIITCAEICAYYSKCRMGEKAEVVYTYKKNVKKPPKSASGKVIYTEYKSVVVQAKNHNECIKEK